MSQAAHNVLNSKNKPIHCEAYPLLRATHTHTHMLAAGVGQLQAHYGDYPSGKRSLLFCGSPWTAGTERWAGTLFFLSTLFPPSGSCSSLKKCSIERRGKKMKKKNTALASLCGYPLLAPPVVADGILNLDWLLPLGDVWGVSSLW